LEFLCH